MMRIVSFCRYRGSSNLCRAVAPGNLHISHRHGRSPCQRAGIISIIIDLCIASVSLLITLSRVEVGYEVGLTVYCGGNAFPSELSVAALSLVTGRPTIRRYHGRLEQSQQPAEV